MSRKAKGAKWSQSDLDAIVGVAAELQGLRCHLTQLLADEASVLLAQPSVEVLDLERLLDRLLDCAGTPEGVAVYRRVCRRLWDLDPQAGAVYVRFYQEIWDPDGDYPWHGG